MMVGDGCRMGWAVWLWVAMQKGSCLQRWWELLSLNFPCAAAQSHVHTKPALSSAWCFTVPFQCVYLIQEQLYLLPVCSRLEKLRPGKPITLQPASGGSSGHPASFGCTGEVL